MIELKIGSSVAESADTATIALKWVTALLDAAASASWPLSAFAIAFLFRDSIRSLLERAVYLKGMGLDLDFRRELEGAREASASVQSDLNAEEPVSPSDIGEQQLQAELPIDPLTSVLTSFRTVEDKLFEITGFSDRRAIRALEKLHIIPADTVNLYNQLLSTRNAALHQIGWGISPYDALEFENLTKVLVAALEGIKPSAALRKHEIDDVLRSMPAISKQRALF